MAYAPLAQLDRVSDYESEGLGFESLMARHEKDPQGSFFVAMHRMQGLEPERAGA